MSKKEKYKILMLGKPGGTILKIMMCSGSTQKLSVQIFIAR